MFWQVIIQDLYLQHNLYECLIRIFCGVVINQKCTSHYRFRKSVYVVVWCQAKNPGPLTHICTCIQRYFNSCLPLIPIICRERVPSPLVERKSLMMCKPFSAWIPGFVLIYSFQFTLGYYWLQDYSQQLYGRLLRHHSSLSSVGWEFLHSP